MQELIRTAAMARTADRIGITDGLRVWKLPDAEPGPRAWLLPHEPGSVDLTAGPTSGHDPAVRVDLDSGRSLLVAATGLVTRHPRTGRWPPDLGICRWTGTCTRRAVRMVPHALMSPVPACRTCR